VSTQSSLAICTQSYAPGEAQWYAVHTRSRHEKFVAYQLQMRGVHHYLPIVTETHRWSDRRQRVEVPLFPGYIFVRVSDDNVRRVEVLRTPGVVRFVGAPPAGTIIPEGEIESVRVLVGASAPWASYPFLKVGQRVRIRGGALDGVEGILLRRNGENSLVISVDAVQRSLAVSINGYDLEAI